jgi:transposase-like protein
MSESRRRFTVDQKAQIFRHDLPHKGPISKLADAFDIQPNQIHNWEPRGQTD